MKISELLTSYKLSIATNPYLIEYENLILANLTTKSKVGITQKHHVIPIVYYEKLHNLLPNVENRSSGIRFAKLDPNNFTVNLSIYDHILAHCYLALSSSSCWFVFANMRAIELLGCKNNDPEQIVSKALTDNNATKLEQVTRCWITKDNITKQISVNYLQSYLDAGWLPKKGKIMSEDLVKKTNNKDKKIWMHKDFENLKVSKSEVLTYLQQGYTVGRHNKKNRVYITVTKNSISEKIKIKNLIYYLQDGYTIDK